MEIREFLLQAGVRRTVCKGPYPNPESPPDNPHPPPPCCKAGVMLIRCIARFWTKYIKVDPVWLQETIEYLLEIKSVKDHANVKNQNGSTALDVVEHRPCRDLKTMEIREFLLQAGVQRTVCKGPYPNPESPPDIPPPPPHCCKAGVMLIRCIARFWTKYIKVDPIWLQEVRGHLITASALTATMAYQSIMSPPGGFWQESKEGGAPGCAILDSVCLSEDDNTYALYLVLNSVVLIASLSTILLAMT